MRTSWFNENANRCYPFKYGTVGLPVSGPLTLANLPNAVIVDCGFWLGARSSFVTGTDNVHLERIRRVGDYFYFDFESDAAEMFDVRLTFTRHIDDETYSTEHNDSGELGISASISDFACEEALWSGFLVTGDLAELALFMPTDSTVSRSTVSQTLVEPSLLHNTSGTFVTSIGLANDDRTRVDGSTDCPDPVWPFETGVVMVNRTCMTGPLLLKAGYNTIIQQSTFDNSIVISAVVGAGVGEPCGEVPLFDGETTPEDSTLFTGGPACNEVLRSINGIGGRLFSIQPGPGITVTALPNENTIEIDINMHGLAMCYNGISQVSEIA